MNNKSCSFCRIAAGQEEAAIFWQDESHIALLDIRPNTPGMALIITKDHNSSDIFEMDPEKYGELLLAAKRVVKILKEGLGVKRVAMVVEGLEIDHAHIKLYPLYGLKKSFVKTVSVHTSYTSKYQGYISTNFGPDVSVEELNKIANKLSKIN